MKYRTRLIHFVAFVAWGLSMAPLLIAGQFQTKEPPLPGQQAMPPQQFSPVPVAPAPFGPPAPPFGPPAPPFAPSVGLMEAPWPPVDPPTPMVKLHVRVVECSPAGKEIEYCIKVENCSSADAHHVVVRNPLPANCRFVRSTPEPVGPPPVVVPPPPGGKGAELVWDFGTLCGGECREITLVLAPTDSADVKNCARVHFEHGQCVVTRIAMAPPGITETPAGIEPPKVTQPPKVIAGVAAKLSVNITGPAKQYANLPAKYQITVVNTGETAADNVLLTGFLPEASGFVGASEGGKYHLNQVAWLLGSLPPGLSKTVQVSYRMAMPGEFCLKAATLANGDIRSETQSCTRFEGISALGLESADTKDPVAIGGQTSYRIAVFNQGSAPLTNVHLQVVVPRELELVRATGASIPPAPDKLGPATAEGQPVSFAPLRELKPGEKQVYEVFVRAIQNGDARWRTVLTADQLTGGPVMEVESTTVFRED